MNEFELRRDGEKLFVVLDRDLTASVVPGLKSDLRAELEKGVLEVEFDLTNTAILDSTGIGLLIATYNSITKKNGGSVRVVRASDDIFRLLQSMRLETRLLVTKR
ncbi:MAG: STAS domain-containing protein [Syntrophobacteraceae bacterium]